MLVRNWYLLFKVPDKWTDSQRQRSEILSSEFPDLKEVYYCALRLAKIFADCTDKNVACVRLDL